MVTTRSPSGVGQTPDCQHVLECWGFPARSLTSLVYHEAVTSSDILEVEWQFAATDTARVAAWLAGARVPGYTIAPGATKDLHDTYFDTADWRIHAARYTCRVRNKGASSELTLKAMAEAEGSMRSRRELTETLPHELAERAQLASPVFAPGPAGQLIRNAVGRRPVMPIFSLHTHRQTFSLADERGTIGEIAVDETTCRLPRRSHTDFRASRLKWTPTPWSAPGGSWMSWWRRPDPIRRVPRSSRQPSRRPDRRCRGR